MGLETKSDQNRLGLGEVRKGLLEVIQGQEQAVELALVALLARGHLLLEGPPGIGKTSLAHGLAGSFRGLFRRIQMTSDLLPGDIVGTIRLNPKSQEIEFRGGPIFSNVLLADELNRTGPKTQAALLEAMAERSVTVDGTTHDLPLPFLVIATQNPMEFQGVYPLSESQLDRFLFHIVMGLPALDRELKVYQEHVSRAQSEGVKSSSYSRTILSVEELLQLQEAAQKVFIDGELVKYGQLIVREIRATPSVSFGGSVRAALQWFDAAKAKAFLAGRDFVLPEDLAHLAPFVFAHRLIVRGHGLAPEQRQELIHEAIRRVVAPK
jgi:MoxR-like ATPase